MIDLIHDQAQINQVLIWVVTLLLLSYKAIDVMDNHNLTLGIQRKSWKFTFEDRC